MIKIPVLNRFTTDDQKFYDTQVNEELKYCACSNYVIQFIDVGKNKRAILITTGKNKLFALGFMKHDYSGINEALATLRLNLALAEKERSDDSNAEISVDSTKPVSGEQKENEIEALTIISSLDELLIDNKPLRKKEDVIRKLIELAMQNENGESYLDFYKAGYDKGIQNYLAMSLYDEDITVNDKVINALAFFKSKDPKIYHLVNSFMRGNFDEMFSYMKSMEEKISTRDVIRISQNIIQAQEELPKRSHDIMIYRAGLGVNKNKNVGAENTYEGFVSFGTSGGTFTGKEEDKSKKPIVYRRILRKEDNAVPVDLLENLGIIYIDETQENEFLLPPFSFRITEIEQGDEFDIFDIVETSKINPRQLLNKRIDELEEYLKARNRLDDYKKLKQARGKITQKARKRITGYNVKDIYYCLRPKKRKTVKKDDDFMEL